MKIVKNIRKALISETRINNAINTLVGLDRTVITDMRDYEEKTGKKLY